MFLRVLVAVLAIWGASWSREAQAMYMVEVCNTVLVGFNGHEAVYDLECRWENWEYGGGGGGGGYFGGGGGGGGYSGGNQNSGWSMLSAIEHQADHPDSATCNADVLARHASANVDVRAENTRLLQENPWDPYPLRVDDLIKVTYSDGGSEVWRVSSSTFTEMISPIPEPGSHQCP